MNTNFYSEVENEIEFFVDKFKLIGWNQEDTAYLTKKLPFTTNPTAKNDEWQHSIGLVLYPIILSYYEKQPVRGYATKIWIQCRVGIDYNPLVKYPAECPRLKKVTDFLKEEINKIGYKSFYDEDSYNGNFSQPEYKQNLGEIRVSFYLNKDYPDGYWENHTL